ncbi:carbohydrate kinase family protein [Bifidobacterium sp. B4081]|uniref:carbohydrate kinase family protein n=1 Tax=unclassified Bifidobacterium TaxID=2608897 RepID=UPI00226AD435|nr:MULTISPECIES: carbohydrate kinase family protein [unclassified Bifidobacterium]MCX8643324.1 carbohydrate kinase family protein [Bifidobacterium sp. B4077]MCX8645506.1 carbohydrate kinase family protein [Bifidobacterium sp. B4081]MCX8668783.1 carbohydrate kinase family protein [Bifidobacterium sp. B3998]
MVDFAKCLCDTNRYVVVIGGMNMDICGRPNTAIVDRDSNPGKVSLSVGGVGQNMAQSLACLDVPTYLVTVYGNDANGRVMERTCREKGIHLEYSQRLDDYRSSTYMFITDETGDMLVAVNDMDICKQITPSFLKTRLDFVNGAAICLLDANLAPETMEWIGRNVTAPLFGDTVSTVKADHFLPILNKMSVLKPNAIEAGKLSGIDIHDKASAEEGAAWLLDKGVKTVYISLGAEGILCASRTSGTEEMVHVPPYPTAIVTANGAGDTGMAAIAWSYFDDPNRPIRDVGRIAQAASSIALECTKAVPDINVQKIRDKMSAPLVVA